jgi:hypothetical protein
MLKVKTLLAQTRAHRPVLISNAGSVSVSFQKTIVGRDVRGYYRSIRATALTNKPGKKPKNVEIRLYWDTKSNYVPESLRQKGKPYGGPEKAPPFTIETPAWVSCSCEYFLYHCEVADTRKYSSSIRYSNGAAPRVTNPQEIGHLCKHLISCLRKGALVVKK